MILGVGSPSSNYAGYTHSKWLSAVNQQLEQSGLPAAIARLTTDMVKKSHQRALLHEGNRLKKQLHKTISDQK